MPLESIPPKIMATAAPKLDPALFPGIIQHYPEHRLLYCQPCSTVVLLRSLPQHLHSCHYLLKAQRRLLLQHCRSLDLITQRKDLQLLPNGSPALQFLPINKGYSCCRCCYMTMSRKHVRNHVNKVHKLSKQACTDSYQLVQLQSWYPGTRAQYWIRGGKPANGLGLGSESGRGWGLNRGHEEVGDFAPTPAAGLVGGGISCGSKGSELVEVASPSSPSSHP